MVWLRGRRDGAAAVAAEDGPAELEVAGEAGGGSFGSFGDLCSIGCLIPVLPAGGAMKKMIL